MAAQRSSDAHSSLTLARAPPGNQPITMEGDALSVCLTEVTITIRSPARAQRLDSRRLKLSAGGLKQRATFVKYEDSADASYATWSVKPPLPIALGSEAAIRSYYRRTIKNPLGKLAISISTQIAPLLEKDGFSEGIQTTCSILKDPFHVALKVMPSKINIVHQPLSLSRAGLGNHIESDSRSTTHSSLNSPKAFKKATEQLQNFLTNPSLVYYESDLSHTADEVYEACKDLELCPLGLFDQFERLGDDILATLTIMATDAYRDRLRYCPKTVLAILRLIRNACSLVHHMAGPGPTDVSEWLVTLLKKFRNEFGTLRRNFEARKDSSDFRLVYQRYEYDTIHDDLPPLSRSEFDRSTMSVEFDKLEQILEPKILETDYRATPCISGTRAAILDGIFSWLEDLNAPNTLWIRGGPGTGKTSIACSILEHLDLSQRCASFFLFRPSLYRPDDYFPTLAYSLAWYHPVFKSAITHTLEKKLLNPRQESTQAIFEELVFKPLENYASASGDARPAPVVVIDSLDACFSRDRASDWDQLIAALSRWIELPRSCKLIITSGIRGDLQESFTNAGFRQIDLLTTDADLDIRKYLEHRMSNIKASHRSSEDSDTLQSWPLPDQLDRLVAHASGYFLWARAAADFIASSASPISALDTLVAAGRTQQLEDLDIVFDSVLTDVFERQKASLGFRATIGAIATARCPISIEDLETLFGERFRARHPRDVCASMVSVMAPRSDDRLSIFHPSFSEYITDADRCGIRHESFIVDATRTHLRFTVACLQLMVNESRGLKFDICGVESPYTDNGAVADEHIDRCIPPSLAYACRYWAEHLRALPEQHNSELRRLLEVFLRTKLLFWIEAMSYLGATESVAKSLVIAAGCIRTSNSDLADLALEAGRFVAIYQDAISSNALHLYTSALPSYPETSRIRAIYSHLCQCSLPFSDTSGGPDTLLSFAFNVGFEIGSMAVFADGKRALVGGLSGEDGEDGATNSVFVFDLQTGEPLASSAPQGHAQDIKSVSISHDGLWAVTASFDRNIILWDISDGIRLVATLQGHNDYVRSVDIDSTGDKIVSGSDDSEILVWNAETKKPLYKPLKGHKDWIRQVRFTQDGLRIISASDDKSIRIWDAVKGLELKKIIGHTNFVLCLALSPDGSTIASGSEDGAVMLFNSHTGRQLRANLQGRGSTPITRIEYALGSEELICGTGDGAIRILNGTTLEEKSQPLLVHNSTITGIHARPSGRRVISVAQDGSAIVWDRDFGPGLLPTPTMDTVLCVRHVPDEDLIIAVDRRRIWSWTTSGEMRSCTPLVTDRRPFSLATFSADGTRIATVARDEVFVWDVATAAQVCEPMSARAAEVTAIALSRDGRYLISSSAETSVFVWDVALGDPVVEDVKAAGETLAVAWSPKEDRYVLDDGQGARLRRLGDEEERLSDDRADTSYPYHALHIAFASDGKQLARCTGDGMITVWDTGNCNIALSRKVDLSPLEESVHQVAFSADLRLLAFQIHSFRSGAYSAPHTMDVHTGWQVTSFLGCGPGSLHLRFAADGRRLISASDDGTIRLNDPFATAPRMISHRCHQDSVRAIAFSPDGRYLASGDDTGKIILWDVPNNTPVYSAEAHACMEWIRALHFTPDGRVLFSAADDACVRRWRGPKLERLGSDWEPHPTPVRAMAISSDGRTLLTGASGQDRQARLWFRTVDGDGNPRDPVPHHALVGHTAAVLCVALTHSADVAATGSADCTVRTWDVVTGVLTATMRGHTGVVRAVYFIPSADARVVSAAEDGALCVWDTRTGTALRTMKNAGGGSVLFSLALLPDGRAVVGGSDGEVRFVELDGNDDDNATPRPTSMGVHQGAGAVLALATFQVSSDRAHIAAAYESGHIVVREFALDDTLSAEEPIAIRGADGWVRNARDEKLLWLTPAHRRGLVLLRDERLIGAPTTQVDLDVFLRGRARIEIVE